MVELRPWGALVRVDGGWALAPVGLTRLARYPRDGVELALPQADEAELRTRQGTRFGFRGRVTLQLRPEAWEQSHRAADGAGLRGLLLEAVRAAGSGLPPGAEVGLATAAVSNSLRERLEAELERRGALLRRLELDAIDLLMAREGERFPPADTRLLLVGLDGADWEIIDPLLEAGRMPHLARLIRAGARGKLLSITPTLSPVVWTSIATGVEPGRHGILDFLVEDPETGKGQPVTSAQRRAATVWEMLSRADVRVGVVGWWATWPAEPVRGYLVTDRIGYQLFGYRADIDDAEGKTWPPELYESIRPLIRQGAEVEWSEVASYLVDPSREEGSFDEDERRMLEEFRTLLASGETYLDVSETLRRERDPQLEVVYLEGTDTVGHLFMPYRAPRRPGIDPARFEAFREIVDRYYETADRLLGRLLEGRGDEWTVMVVSDHGFASDASRPRLTDSRIGHGAAADWHRRFGVVVLSGRGVRRGVRLGEASIYDIAPTVLALFGQPVPRSWPGGVLGEALTDDLLERQPVRLRLDDPPRRLLLAGEQPEDPAATELVRKLMSLGYVGSGSGEEARASAGNNAGVALLAEGKYEEAERTFRDVLDGAERESPSVLVNLGIAVRNQGRAEEARELFERAFRYRASRRVAGHLLAQLAIAEGRLEDAERLLRTVLQGEPGAAEVHASLGMLLDRRGDRAGAAEAYRKAADLDPNGAQARNGLGNLAKWEGDLASAERWYRAAIEADPFYMGAYNNLALVLQADGRLGEAIDLYSQALVKAPMNAVVLNNLASLYHAQGDRSQADRLWRRAAGADPAYPSPLNNLASLAIEDRRWADAERLLRSALELDPAYGDARVNLGIVYKGTGNMGAARDAFREAAGDERSIVPAMTQLGYLEYEQGRFAEAAAALQRARMAGATDVTVLNALGEAYRILNDPQGAADAWAESLRRRPGQPEIRARLEGLDP